MSVWHQSLTFRLVSLFVAVVAVLLVGLGWLTMTLTDRHFLELDEMYLRDKGALVREISNQSPDLATLVTRLREALGNQTGLGIAVFQNSQPVYIGGPDKLPTELGPEFLNKPSGQVLEWQNQGQSLRAIAIPAQLSNAVPDQEITAVLSLDTEHHDHFMEGFRRLIWFYVAIAIMVGGLLGWWAARKGLDPLRPIIQKTRKISATQLSDRIATEQMPLELQPLTQTLNNMLARLEQDFSRLSAFSSDLAHELRTPISNMLVQAQVTLGKHRHAEQYQEALWSFVEELERLSHMVSDMLYLAKTEHQVELPRRQAIDLFDEANEIAEFYQLTADDKNVAISVSGSGRIQGDRNMVRRAASNLVSNAIRHATPGSTINIAIAANEGEVRLRVANRGETIAPDDIGRIFDRFYRAEKSRVHPGTDGTGLGLAITRAIMTAHGATIGVTSREGITVFELIFQAHADNAHQPIQEMKQPTNNQG